MSIWSKVDNTKEQNGNFELGGGEPIPDDTSAIAYIKDVGWSEYEGDYYINIQWSVLKPVEFKNRVVFQKIRVNDSDKAKQEKAIRMLMAIDFNAGGTLPKDRDPTDSDLAQHLSKKMMGIKIKTWEMNGNKGNWICAVSAKDANDKTEAPEPQSEQQMSDDLQQMSDDLAF